MDEEELEITLETPRLDRPRWPRVLGTLGIVLGIIAFIDKLDDLLIPFLWTKKDWIHMVGPEVGEFVARSMPTARWVVFSSIVGMVLASILIAGSLHLRRHRRTGVRECRAWAWLAIAWVMVEAGRIIAWFGRYGDQVPVPPGTEWQGTAAFAIALALLIMLAYPIFLLLWLRRPDVKIEYLSWPN